MLGGDVVVGRTDTRATRSSRSRRHVWGLFGAGGVHGRRCVCKARSDTCEGEEDRACYQERAVISMDCIIRIHISMEGHRDSIIVVV